jgi:hypothetical protein
MRAQRRVRLEILAGWQTVAVEKRAMNTIFVHELRVETRIGIYAWEQHLAQPLLIDLELALPSAKAFASDVLPTRLITQPS